MGKQRPNTGHQKSTLFMSTGEEKRGAWVFLSQGNSRGSLHNRLDLVSSLIHIFQDAFVGS